MLHCFDVKVVARVYTKSVSEAHDIGHKMILVDGVQEIRSCTVEVVYRGDPVEPRIKYQLTKPEKGD